MSKSKSKAKATKVPDRDDLHIFLVSGLEMMKSDETRARLADPEQVERPGLELIVLQRQGWAPLGVDADEGCQALDTVDIKLPDDEEILGLRNAFIQVAQMTYLQALDDRRPATLEDKRRMPRKAMIEFFDACNTKMRMPDFCESLVTHLRENNAMPNQLVIEAQRDLLEVIGFERDHGCQCLSRLLQDFPDDIELRQRFGMWQQFAHNTVMSAVKAHMARGGTLPSGAFSNGVPAQFAEMQQRAREEVAAMSSEEKAEVAKKMEQKFRVFMNLPEEGRLRHMQSLSEEEKMEYAKAQIILVTIMQEQWTSQKGPRPEQGGMSAGASAPPVPSAAPPPRPVTKPSQQEMSM